MNIFYKCKKSFWLINTQLFLVGNVFCVSDPQDLPRPDNSDVYDYWEHIDL